MGWNVPWYTLSDDFDADFGVDEWHGTNAFIRDGERIFRTYFINSRGDEAMGSTWSYLDITRARAPRGVGGLLRGPSPDAALPMVELPRRVRRARVIAHSRESRSRSCSASAGSADGSAGDADVATMAMGQMQQQPWTDTSTAAMRWMSFNQ